MIFVFEPDLRSKVNDRAKVWIMGKDRVMVMVMVRVMVRVRVRVRVRINVKIGAHWVVFDLKVENIQAYSN